MNRINSINRFFSTVSQNRSLILALALRDFHSRYSGTMIGAFWALMHPLAIVTIYYFVFAIGFRVQGPGTTPFILWFVCGLVPWFFFGETLKAITDSITSNSHLVKKTIFPTEILSLVHLTSGLFSHIIFMLILITMIIYFRAPLYANRFFVIYYLICNCTLLIGLGWMLSALQVFFRDISQGLNIVLNLIFWVTPIVWSPEILPEKYRDIISYNPFTYIVEGYRGTLIYNGIDWPGLEATVYFWSFNLVTFFVGTYVFFKLKPEFPDSL